MEDMKVKTNAWAEIADMQERASKRQRKLNVEKADRLARMAQENREKANQ